MLQEVDAVARNLEPTLVPLHVPGGSPASEAISILCYENEVPPFVVAELNRLYENLYSSFAHLHAGGKLDKASTYVVRKGREIVTLLLFRMDGRRLTVLNEVIRIDEEDIYRFASHIFAAFQSIQVISFRAVQTNLRRLPFRFQQFDYLEDIVVALPSSADDYIASLGKKTRGNMRRYLKLIKRDFPSFRFDVFENEAIEQHHVHDIMAMYRSRMSAKNKVLDTDDEEVEQLINCVRENGSVGVVTINGCVCAGAIASRVGANYFLRVLAHDPEYNKYSLGTLCCYLAISDCIMRGAREFHFLWGESDYKYLLSGVRRALDFLAIYRSRTQLLLNIDIAIKARVRSVIRTALRYLHRARRQDTLPARLVTKSLDLARSAKRKMMLLVGMFYSGVFEETLGQWAIIL